MDATPEFERSVDALLREPATERLAQTLAALPAPLIESPAADMLRAELLRRRGEPQQAASLYAQALQRAPHLHAAYHGAALACVACGNASAARALWMTLLQRHPADAIARYQIGLSWHDERNFVEAARWYEQQLEHFPATFAAARNLGLVCLAQDDAETAVRVLERATALDPRHARGWDALGTALRRAGRLHAAADAWQRAFALEPKAAAPLARAAEALAAAAELPAAIALQERAVGLEPHNAALRFALAAQLSSLGLHDDALRRLREAIALDPTDARGSSALLVELQYYATQRSRDEASVAHRQWSALHAAPTDAASTTAPSLRPRRRAGERLRVGYVSPRFGAGPLECFFLPVLQAHDRSRFRITLYSAFRHEDDAATRLRAACDLYRELPADDAAAAAMIAADGQDLLIDLAGHAPGNRLGVLVRKPAPVQATWLDWFDTTGVAAIDYLLTDAVHTPATDVAHYAERVVWLPHCRFAYAPVVVPEASPAPRDRNGYVTFGSFNRHAKIGDDVLALWKSVLDAVPGSRLQLRASAYRGSGTVAWLRERWARAGLPVDRIDLRPYVPIAEAMRAYHDIDIALDPFPYNGGATTCDALAHGVPVIALAGDRMIARQGAALLHAARHPEWAATSRDEYVRLAVRLARTADYNDTRRALFDALPSTPLCDVDGFARALESACLLLVETGPRIDAGATRAALSVTP